MLTMNHKAVSLLVLAAWKLKPSMKLQIAFQTGTKQCDSQTANFASSETMQIHRARSKKQVEICLIS
jgi:hypothetical protein